MVQIHNLSLNPPILNSSSLWASSYEQLEELYKSDWTGAVTIRTATLSGFPEDAKIHKHALLNPDSSINSYGYSPYPLSRYIAWIDKILAEHEMKHPKPFIISIAPSSVEELNEMMDMIQNFRRNIDDTNITSLSKIGIELNTSCPNIPGYPPPAYDPESLNPLLSVFQTRFAQDPSLTIGLKLAPYVHAGQFQKMIELLASISSNTPDGEPINCISFLSCTNTLGSTLVFQDQIAQGSECEFALPTATGGLAGQSIHALSLGNVYSFKRLLSAHLNPSLRRISIIGIGGVSSKEAVERMHRAGASAVACATALGTYGPDIFKTLNTDFVVEI